MNISDWAKHDGYEEASAGITAEFNPVFKLQVVLLDDGKHRPIVRDCVSGFLLEEGPAMVDQGAAKYQTMRLADAFLNRIYQSMRTKLINSNNGG